MLTFASCQSKEKKASELIKKELSKTLYDFDSYEPIETTVKKAYNKPENDSICFTHAILIAIGLKETTEKLKDAKEAKERMEIWGAPSYSSSLYSDRQYYKYKKEFDENMREAKEAHFAIQLISKSLEDTITCFDGSKTIGWEVKHRFRCKTKGGIYTIGDYRYIISSNFKKIIFQEDLDDEDYKAAHKIIEDAIDQELSEEFNINF
jgi:hypothetical protein